MRTLKRVKSGMIGVKNFCNLGYSSFTVSDEMKLLKPADQGFHDFLHPVSLERSKQNQRNRGKIDHPADPYQPDGAGKLLLDKIPVKQIQHQGNH